MTVMLETEELNISEITRRVGLSHSATARHLDFLTKSGLLREKRFNRIRIFRVDRSDLHVEALMKFLAEWKAADSSTTEQVYN
ncbi:MAG TPA: winged helix-turn-helix domain-containing protein [Nitrososphaerales archaeon]|nr:winged helix-turn-helix domain-containing protein [Nitrososphaerales archaeon]